MFNLNGKKSLVHYYTMPRSGTNIVYGSVRDHFIDKGYNIISTIDAYDNHETFNEPKVINKLDYSRNNFLISHGDFTDAFIDKVHKNFNLCLFTIQRKDSYKYFLTNLFNYFFLNQFLKNKHKAISDLKMADLLYDELVKQIPNKPILITHKHIINSIEYYIRYLTLKQQLKEQSICHYEWFYEDLALDPESHVKQCNISFKKELSSIKFRKPDYHNFFSNIDDARIMWYSMLNKRLKICGIAE